MTAPLRRAQVSFAAMWAGESAFMVALAVFAFGDGGVAAVGLVTAVRMATAAFLTPFLATLADRVRRERVLIAIGVVRAAALAGAAVASATGAPASATYGCAVVATVALALYRPAHSALLPALASSPAELTAANAVRGLLDSLATLGGPVLAAALLATTGPSVVFAVCSVLSLLAGLVVAALPYDAPPRAEGGRTSVTRDLLGGFATIARDRRLSLITGLGVVQTFTRGCLTVFLVVVAIDLLGTGDAGVGILGSAIGAGGVLGSLVAFRLVRRGGLASWYGVGIALFGAPLAVLGVLPAPVTAVLLLGLVGVGNALIDVAGFTMLARLTDETVLARMFAGFEALLTLGVALGGLVAPLVVNGLGLRTALVAIGLLAPFAVLACRAPLRRLDGEMRVRDADIAVLRAVPMLGALPAATIQQLGARLTHLDVPAGQVVFEQGERGDAFYVVESGRAEVVRNARPVNTLGPGEGFGEVALLGDRPRTATVSASADAPVRLAVLSSPAFLTAVTGYPVSAGAAIEAVARIRARDDGRDDAD
jgi:MFS family permease